MKKGIIAVAISALCAALVVPTVAFGLGGAPAGIAAGCAWGPMNAVGMFGCVHTACGTVSDCVAAYAYAEDYAAAADNSAATVDDGSYQAVTQETTGGYATQGSGQDVGQNAGSANYGYSGYGCAGYIDNNGDGICDNYSAYGCHHGQYIDQNNDGICDNYSGQGNGSYGNGYSNSTNSNGNGTSGNYYGHGCGRGYGQGYGHHGVHHR